MSRVHGKGGSRRRSRQSDKVKPLPCTLTEVFHATAAWRQNPTRRAGIAFQTGMPVDNVRPPVISITIIPSGSGRSLYLRTDKLPSSPTPPSPCCRRSSRPSEPIRFAITSVSFRPRGPPYVLASPARPGQSPTDNAQCPACTHYSVHAWESGCEMLSEIMRRRPRRSALCRLDRTAATSVDVH